MKKKLILVTGSHRSGTTWTARVISAHPKMNYIAEPFNPGFNHPANPATDWFPYLDPDDEHPEYIRYIKSRSQITLRGLLAESEFLFRKGYRGAYFREQWNRLFRPYQLIKDPIAFFSAEWLAENFDMKVIVLIRHPAAFVSSLKLKGWTFDFNQLLNQKKLVEKWLIPFVDEMKKQEVNETSVVEQGILLWNMFYHVTHLYQQNHPEWHFIRHEDLSATPESRFEEIFKFLNIPFHAEVKKIIEKTTGNYNTNTEYESKTDSIKRNSIQNIKIWKERLTENEINRIKSQTEAVWKSFYTESDW